MIDDLYESFDSLHGMYNVVDSADLARSVVADIEVKKAEAEKPRLSVTRLVPLDVERDHNGLIVSVDGLTVERNPLGLIVGLR